MLSFEIPAMSCGHCVRAITQTVQAVDPQAEVSADIPAQRVQVQTNLPREAFVPPLTDAGYAPA